MSLPVLWSTRCLVISCLFFPTMRRFVCLCMYGGSFRVGVLSSVHSSCRLFRRRLRPLRDSKLFSIGTFQWAISHGIDL